MQEECQENKREKLDIRLERWWEKIPKVVRFFLYLVLFAFVASTLVCIFRHDQELAKFIGYSIGGVLVIWQISVSNRRAAAAEKTAELTEKGNIAERFKNAIEHLGSDSVSIRLGGIYALHNLAREEHEYRKQVFEILCAHIRETTSHKDYQSHIASPKPIPPSIEIQSILNILFIEIQDRKIYTGLQANLRYANLERANLGRANLKGAKLARAKLKMAYLTNAELQYATFLDTDLNMAVLSGANLQECSFFLASLRDVLLHDARNLETQQLLEAKTLYNVNLPKEIEEEIRRKKPDLLKKPKY